MSFFGIKTKADRKQEAIEFSIEIEHTLQQDVLYYNHRQEGQKYETDNFEIERIRKWWWRYDSSMGALIWEPKAKTNCIVGGFYFPSSWYYKKYRKKNAERCVVVPPHIERILLIEELDNAVIERKSRENYERNKENIKIQKRVLADREIEKQVEKSRVMTRFDLLDL